MPKVRVHNFSVSLDGNAAGPDQSADDPLGVGGRGLHTWAFNTPTFRANVAPDGDHVDDRSEPSVDEMFARRMTVGVGATIMGRNMFGPIRGPWGDDGWRGWWGDDQPYHHAVFVLTHHAHDPIEMEGGTTFHFVTDGPEAALERAIAAPDGADVQVGGGASTVQQYLRAGLIDEMHLAIVPELLGTGERVFGDIDLTAAGYVCVESAASDAATHAVIARKV